MGFYGNITNTSKTQFQFDRIYSSRTEMDTQKYQDGIYAGRYVLVEYDQQANLQLDTFLYVIFDDAGNAYNQNDDAKAVIKVGDMKKRENPYVYTADINKDPSLGITPKNCVFYKWTNTSDGDTANATFIHVVESENNYTINYKLDTEKYGEGRGYDSTVWQKMYIDNIEKYVMIAELNTVVPTFAVTADAPTMNPIVPHFDPGSTDVYYKLHYQPQWGVRLKGEENNIEINIENEDESKIISIVSTDSKNYPSDHTVKYEWSEYDAQSGVENRTEVEYPAAIYYNKAGFSPEIHTRYEGEEAYDDEISILPTGVSGNLYNNHIGDASVSVQPDIQELKILLPAIGNMVSDAWDMIYGYNPDNENKRYRDIEWKFIEDEDREGDLELGGMTRNLETFSGCINTIHDLIGMIITKVKPDYPTEEDYNNGYIYLSENIVEDEEGNEVNKNIIYERLIKMPTYKIVDISNFKIAYENWLNTSFTSTQEKNAAYEALFADFTSSSYYIKEENDEYKFINIRALPEYLEEIIYEDDSFIYDYVEIQGLETHLLTLLGALITCRNLLGTDTPSTTDRTTVQGALNALNSIIDRFKDATPGQFTFVDEDGKLISMNWTTKQPYDWNNLGTQEKGIGENIENRYIDLTFDFDRGNIELTHKFNKINDTTTVSDKNTNEGTGNNVGIGDTIDLYTPIVDNMGHVVGNNIETITLPYGYKIIKVENNETVTSPAIAVNANGQIADNTQDTLNFNASNRWIKIDNNTEDTIKLGHRLTVLESGEANKKYGLEKDIPVTDLDKDNTFGVPVLRFDEAGHINFAETHTVSLPENYDKIEVIISPENFQNEKLIQGTAASIVADTMTDTLSIKQGNKWAIIEGNATDDSITFSHYVNKFNESESSTNFNNTANGKVFYTQEIAWDEAGHLISSNKHNFTLPDNFKVISITNSGSTNKAVNASITNGELIADTLVDTATIDAGNRWIQLKANTDEDKVTIYHAPAGSAPSGNTTFNDNETPNYGVAFTIPEVKYDEAGHISAVDTHTVKFPTPSLNENLTATGSSVLTGFELVPGTLSITQTNADVGTLKLTQYIQAAGDTLTSNDTINGALNKLSTRIKNHEDQLNALIGGELKEKFDTLVEMSNWLDSNDTELLDSINKLNADLTKAINSESSLRQESDTNLTNIVNTEISNRKEAIRAVNDDLTAEITARVAADNKHTGDIKINTDAISAINNILPDKFDGNTLFDWGYQRVETPGTETEIINGDPVLDEEGNPTYDEDGNQIFEQIEQVKNFITISYEPYKTTLQNILNEILEYHKDLRAIGSDDGNKIYTN